MSVPHLARSGGVIAARRHATANVAAGTAGAWSATLPRGASSS